MLALGSPPHRGGEKSLWRLFWPAAGAKTASSWLSSPQLFGPTGRGRGRWRRAPGGLADIGLYAGQAPDTGRRVPDQSGGLQFRVRGKVAHSSSLRPKQSGVTISDTDLRTNLAKHLEVAHYQSQHLLVERSHEPFLAILGIEEYRRLRRAAGEAGGSKS
jgi:hypothetical protein